MSKKQQPTVSIEPYHSYSVDDLTEMLQKARHDLAYCTARAQAEGGFWIERVKMYQQDTTDYKLALSRRGIQATDVDIVGVGGPWQA